MITLIKIRTKYLTNHLCSVYFSYFLIPSLLLISFIFVFYNAFTRGSNEYQDIKTDWTYSDISKSLFSQDFSSLKNISLVSDDEKDKQILKELTNLDIEWANDINKLPNKANNIYKIINKGEKYKIELIQKKESYYFSENDLKTIYFDPFTPNEANYLDESKLNIFIKLQSLFAQFLIKKKGKSFSQKELNIQFGQNSYPPHIKQNSKSFDYKITFFTFGFSLQFTMTSYFFCMRMIDEKEKKLTELLQRQGISNISYFFSWFLTYLFIIFIPIIIYLLFYWIITPLHILLFTLDIILFILSIYSFTYFLYICIKKSKTGSVVIKFINFSTSILGLGFISETIPKSIKIISALIPQINVYHCAFTLDKLQVFKSLSWEKVWLRTGKISFMESIIMYLVEIIFYSLLSLIIIKFRNSGLGFCQFLLSCCKKVSRKIDLNEENNINENKILNFESHFQELSPINQQKKEAKDCLSIVNVTKNFDSLKAVDNFNGDLFGNEIFCLLGHNGAGKTTLINMISGIYDPNHGDILFNGKSLVTNKNYLYENIGLCQQEDIYFDYLTVKEHLEYMCSIKGSKINKQEIQELMDKIELTPKKDALCSTLSGGQKRKLCIALALIGGSQIILLDEPTSGMDAMARRKLWEFLKNYKKDKIMLLTTHYLDEAEYLGDRIGIMSDGHFLCSGTSSFLKSKYPCGFNLNLLTNPERFNEDIKLKLFENVAKYDPKAEIRVVSKGIFSINIQSNNNHIPEIFDYIEQKKEEGIILDYTVSSTSLEDVFLRINNKSSLNDIKYIKNDIIKQIDDSEEEKEDVENNNLLDKKQVEINIKASSFCSQLLAQVKRGMYPLIRNKILFIFELLSGLGFVYIFIFFFSEFIINASIVKLSLFDILNEYDVYYYEKNTNDNYLRNSYAYNLKKSIPLTKIKNQPKDIIDFMNLSYEQAFNNIAKGGIYVDSTNSELTNFYNTEIDTSLDGYLFANTMLAVSAFLKNSYNIDAVILHELELNSFSDNGFREKVWNFFKDFVVLIVVCLIALFGFVIFLGGLMFEKIREKKNNIKHLLYLSGSNTWSYWLGFFIVDFIKLIFFNIFLIFPIYYVSGVGTYFGLDMIAISISSLSFIYFVSFFCKKEDEGAKILFVFVFGFIVLIAALAIIFRDKILKYSSSFIEIYKLNLMDLTPVTSMGLSFLRIIISYKFWDAADIATNKIKDIFAVNLDLNEINGFYRPKVYLYTSFMAQAINFVVYTLLLIIAESGLLESVIHSIQLFFINITNNYVFSEETASDEFISNNNLISSLVSNEEKNINENSNNIIIRSDSKTKIHDLKNPANNIYVQKEKEKLKSDRELSTKISGLRKTFFVCCGKNVRAINNLYLGLEPNEKFGLLGFNGSGKTTTFKAITNEILTDSGTVNLFGYDNKRQFKYIRTMIGYCPQINPLFDFMKVKEIIEFYSDLKTSNESVESICTKFGLSKYLNTYTINLSGGNKRKLTFAIAMMNKPTLLLLDEPSTGVDPESRRVMWRNINELSNSGHKYNMILTTHSMEEAEILCDTVSWLKAGNFICVGNPEELKIEYSAGYKLHIKFDDNEINKEINNDKVEDVFNTIKEYVDGFDIFENIILKNKDLIVENYLNGLIKIVKKIKDKAKKISINEIGKDLSFELIIEIIKEKQKEMFTEILNMKNVNKEISEINITMQSLENILTSLN